jgi:hypothetical protein
LRSSKDGKKALYIDKKNAGSIFEFLNRKPSFKNKFNLILELILNENRPPRDLYDKENIDKHCANVTAIKLAKGKDNPRIYCQQFSRKDKQVFIIVASELLEKKNHRNLLIKKSKLFIG